MANSSMKAAGIDTGKHTLEVALSSGKSCLQIGNDISGYRELGAWLRRRGIKRAGIEASGGYERGVVGALRAQGFEVAVLQPIQVRAYARFKLKRAKNDRIDARLIAECTAGVEDVRTPPDPKLAAMSERLRLIEQLDEDIARAKTRLEGYRQKELIAQLKSEIKRLGKWRKEAIGTLLDELRLDAALAKKLALLTSIPGIGERTALAMLIRMPELGRLSREEAASLAGLAPYDDDSADRHGQRHIAGGRHRLRKAIYAAALPAAFRWNQALVALYKRLLARGKPHKLALVACARKLIVYANTVLARGTPWLASPEPV
ncbi:MAG TPA: IS110 family transposase [Rhizomicrobium sp.]